MNMGINRNIVECKVPYADRYFSFPVVLIETLWNVKSNDSGYCSAGNSVLIETLWNVKSD